MEEIAKMLKRFGPKYELRWRMEYFGPEPCMVIILMYFDTRLNTSLKVDQQIPMDQIDSLSDHAPRIIDDMQRRIQVKIQDIWGEYKY